MLFAGDGVHLLLFYHHCDALNLNCRCAGPTRDARTGICGLLWSSAVGLTIIKYFNNLFLPLPFWRLIHSLGRLAGRCVCETIFCCFRVLLPLAFCFSHHFVIHWLLFHILVSATTPVSACIECWCITEESSPEFASPENKIKALRPRNPGPNSCDPKRPHLQSIRRITDCTTNKAEQWRSGKSCIRRKTIFTDSSPGGHTTSLVFVDGSFNFILFTEASFHLCPMVCTTGSFARATELLANADTLILLIKYTKRWYHNSRNFI